MQIRPVLHRVHSGRCGSQNRIRAVGMGHHRQARLVGRFDHDPNLLPVQGFFREDAEPVQIHQAGNHNFDEIPSGIPYRSDQRPVRLPSCQSPGR